MYVQLGLCLILLKRCETYCLQTQPMMSFSPLFILCINSALTMKTYPCSEYTLKPHFYIVKLGYAGVYLFFLFLVQNIDCGYSLEPPRQGSSNVYRVPTIYVLSKNMKSIKIFLMKFSIFTAPKNLCILHWQVFVMDQELLQVTKSKNTRQKTSY